MFMIRFCGSKRNKFLKYLKKVFPKYMVFKYSMDYESSRHYTFFRYGNYFDFKRYPDDKFKKCMKNCYFYDFFFNENEKFEIFTLFKMQGYTLDMFGLDNALCDYFNLLDNVRVGLFKYKTKKKVNLIIIRISSIYHDEFYNLCNSLPINCGEVEYTDEKLYEKYKILKS